MGDICNIEQFKIRKNNIKPKLDIQGDNFLSIGRIELKSAPFKFIAIKITQKIIIKENQRNNASQ